MTASRIGSFLVGAFALVSLVVVAGAQAPRDTPVAKPTLPNPYRLVPDWPTLPASMKGPNGRKWGEVIRVHVAPNGNIWVFHRCFNDQPNGDATCVNRGEANPPILEFDPAGRLLRASALDYSRIRTDSRSIRTGTSGPPIPMTRRPSSACPRRTLKACMIGQQVLKISPTGKVLMTIGTPGVGGNGPNTFDRPTGVSIAPNGNIFVSDGHSGNKSKSARVVKYSPDGKFIKTWGRMGPEPGNFGDPHDLYVGGSKGYVYVADRQNSRIQVFDQDGNLIAAWKQFGQPSSVYVDRNDNIYVGATYQDPSRGSVTRQTTGPNDRAIVIGNAITGELKYLIPDPGDLSKMTGHRNLGVGHRGRRPGEHLCRGCRFQQPEEIHQGSIDSSF